MAFDINYKEFCRQYYPLARKVADITIAKLKKGETSPKKSPAKKAADGKKPEEKKKPEEEKKKDIRLDPRIDLTLVKDMGVTEALWKAYNHYDPENEKGASIETYLSRVVHNCVLSALEKEGHAIGAGKSDPLSETTHDKPILEGFTEKREELLTDLKKCLQKLNPQDQVILFCFINSPRTYTTDAIEELGWDPESRNIVQVRKNRAIAALQTMMSLDADIYNDIRDGLALKPETGSRSPISKRKSPQQKSRRRELATRLTAGIDYQLLCEGLSRVL